MFPSVYSPLPSHLWYVAMLQSLLSPNHRPKTSVNTIEDPIPTPCHGSNSRTGWSVDFRVHNISYNIPISGMTHTIINAEHSDQWCITALPFINMHPQTLMPDTVHYAMPVHSDKADKKTCYITYDQPLYIKAPSTMRWISELSSVVACLVDFRPLISFIWGMWCSKVDF